MAEIDNKIPNAGERLDETRGSVNVVGGKGKVHDEALRQRFEQFIEDHPHLSTAVLQRSDHIGVSKTALDAVIKGEYFLKGGPNGTPINPKNSKVEPKIREYLDRVQNVGRNVGYDAGFVQTVLSSQIEYALTTAITENIIVVAYGSPGDGKSFSLQQYILDKLTTPPITILCSRNITPGYFVKRLATELGLKNIGGIPETEDRIAEALIKRKRNIFIDQANYLNERSLGTVCHIWERARIGIALVGTQQLHDLFAALTDKEDIKAQLASRVALHVPLKGLSLNEVIPIVNQAIGADATSEVTAAVYNAIAATSLDTNLKKVSSASFRNLSFLLPRLKGLIDANRSDIDRGVIKAENLVPMATKQLLIG